MNHQYFALNTKGRDFFVGDIHGCLGKLHKALAQAGFDYENDRLFSVGDLADRGEDSMGVVREFYIRPNWFAVRGNHEQMTLDAYDGRYMMAHQNHLQNGGLWTVSLLDNERTMVLDYFRSLPIALTVETSEGPVGVVHADCRHDNWQSFVHALEALPVDGEPPHDAMWSRDRWREYTGEQYIEGVRAVVVGHTPRKNFRPEWKGNVLNLDTHAYAGGPITVWCFDQKNTYGHYMAPRNP